MFFTKFARWRAALVLSAITFVAAAVLVGCERSRTDKATASPHSPKRLWHCGMDRQVIQDHPGDCPICHMALTPMDADSTTAAGAEKKVLYWWDPMLGPSSISDHPGKSAMNMDMVPVYADQAGPTVAIDPILQQNMGVRTASVTRGPLTKIVRTVGILQLPEPGMHDVSLKIGGWIDKLYADQDGAHVVAGEALFDLYSPDLLVAGQELISAIKSQKALPEGASPESRQEAQRMVDSSKRKLRLWDIADQDIDAIAKADSAPRDVPIRSPATGHIEEKMIVQGSAVQAGMKLMRVAGHETMWLEAQVYPDQLSAVKMGQEVTATIDGMPDHAYTGKITFIYPHVDHMARTLTVRMTLDNPQFELKPGMYATADIVTGPMPDVVQAPREAVIDTGTRQIAFVDAGSGHFEPRIVHMGMIGDGEMVQILSGLSPGESVVTSGQFLMDVESRTIEATRKMTEQTAMGVMSEAAPTSATRPAP